MVIIDVNEYVDVVGIAETMTEIGVPNAMAASSLLAEEVCLFYLHDLMVMRGETFVIEPKPRYYEALGKIHKLGHIGLVEARRCLLCCNESFFNLKGLKSVLQHLNYLYRPVDVQPLDARPSGLLVARLKRNEDE